MKPALRRTALPAGCWWIVRRQRGRITVILDEAVPAGSASEQLLIALAMRDWRHSHRARIGVVPASTVATGAALLLVVTATAVVYVLTGAGVVSGPQDGWAEAPQPSSPASPPSHRPEPPGPARSPAGRPAASQPMSSPSLPVAVSSGTPAPTASPSLTSPPLVVPSTTPVVRRPVRKLRKTVRPPMPLPVKVQPPVRPCELLGLPVGHCR